MKFRKKPVVISAEQWTGPECLGKIEGVRETFSSPVAESIIGPGPWYVIDTLEGTMRVHPGDWIITGVEGEKYPCKPDIFAATYETADEIAELTPWEAGVLQRMASTKHVSIEVTFVNPDSEEIKRGVEFTRAAKIKDLLGDPGSLGEMLRAMLAPVPVDDVDVESVSRPMKKAHN